MEKEGVVICCLQEIKLILIRLRCITDSGSFSHQGYLIKPEKKPLRNNAVEADDVEEAVEENTLG